MNCPFCRNQIPENAEFCPSCGANIKQQPVQQPMQQPINNVQPQQSVYNNTPNEPKKSSKKGLLIILAIPIVNEVMSLVMEELTEFEKNNTENQPEQRKHRKNKLSEDEKKAQMDGLFERAVMGYVKHFNSVLPKQGNDSNRKLKYLEEDGIEVYYPYRRHRAILRFATLRQIKDVAAKYNLLITGGTDCHTRNIMKY